MAAAHSRTPDVVRRVISTQRGFLLRELRNLEVLRRDHDNDPVVGLLLAAAVRHVTADLTFLDDAEQTLLSDNGETLARIARPATPEHPQANTPGSDDQRSAAAG
ncbi:hypothetical protein ACFFX1_05810 [Dactylosporangium sucinum]|uniref:Uncharacterized protein n=1 Tax=Dactylosporangium sucinum TaxID=1424081 RepID=A0A917UGB2_9ACTN|nr:hypothetical protein [Dactylosporangium sucinum]GGM87358.1 hypothetical protein GCM10007977_106630 [Dactylosporangium sucinum]